MKKILLSIALLTFIGMMSVNGQSELIISDNFQGWEASQEIVVPDSCEAGYEHPPELSGTLDLLTSAGHVDITVKLVKCSISPECGSKKNPGVAVSDGYISLMKMDGKSISDLVIEDWGSDVDTLGQFSFGPIPQIDSISFEHSATGSERGIRIFKSTDGETWERATQDEFNDGDSQSGVTHSVVIDEEDVYIKFTSGFKTDQTSQISRLHNLMVYGVPGVLSSIKDNTKENMLSIYPVPASDYVIIELAEQAVNTELQIIDILGKAVYRCVVEQQTSNIDISNLNSGMYFIQIIQNDKKYVKQLVVN